IAAGAPLLCAPGRETMRRISFIRWTAASSALLAAWMGHSRLSHGWANSEKPNCSSYAASGSQYAYLDTIDPNRSDYNSHGLHDIIARSAYHHLKNNNASQAAWITNWWSNTVWNSDDASFLAWTDDPDFEMQDWPAHGTDHHQFGYHSAEPPNTYGPLAQSYRYD